MSIELQLRLGSDVVPKAALFQALSDALRGTFAVEGLPSWEASPTGGATLGRTEEAFQLTVGTDAQVEVRCHSIGSEETFGFDGGWWVCVSVALRTPESKLLMLLASACLARVAGTGVFDESAMFGLGQTPAPEDLLALVGRWKGTPFSEAARFLDLSMKDGST